MRPAAHPTFKQQQNLKMVSIFNSLSQQIFETCDRIVKVLEEGSALIFDNNERQRESYGETTDEFDIGPDEDLNPSSPLDGMAQGVLDDIMSTQVCF